MCWIECIAVCLDTAGLVRGKGRLRLEREKEKEKRKAGNRKKERKKGKKRGTCLRLALDTFLTRQRRLVTLLLLFRGLSRRWAGSSTAAGAGPVVRLRLAQVKRLMAGIRRGIDRIGGVGT